MTRKFVSPGVFTQEIDQSFIAQGIANIGAAVIGSTLKGPAFAPLTVSDFNEFVASFGDVSSTLMAPYTAKNYLKNSSVLNVVRVLGSRDGKSITNGSNVSGFGIKASGTELLAVVFVPSGTVATISGSGTNIHYTFSGTAGAFAGSVLSGTASMVPSSASYIGNIWNPDATLVGTYGHFLYKNFEWAGTGTGAPYTTSSLSGTELLAAGGGFDFDFTEAITPWVRSQPFGAGGPFYSLFRFHTIADGNAANTDIKVTITNIRASPFSTITNFGTFDVIVRVFSDTDQRLNQVETFSNVTLDPASQNYMPRVIGDQYVIWNSTTRKNVLYGTYKSHSRYVFVEMATAGAPAPALPWGHTGYTDVLVSGSTLRDVPYVLDTLDSQGNPVNYFYWGIDLAQIGVADRLKFSLAASSAALAPTAQGTAFDLTYVNSTSSGGSTWSVYTVGTGTHAPSTGTSERGFTMVFQGGFDGWDPTQPDPLAAAGTAGSVAQVSLKLGVDILSNPDEIDLNLLAIPGVSASAVTAYGRQMCNDRADVMMIVDIGGTSVAGAISDVNNQGVDDNYAACYYPHLRYSDTTNGVLVDVPPSVAVLGAYAYSDRVGQVFFAPAGLNRGGLAQFGIVDTADRLTFQDRNDLYENRINPIATFPNEGIVVFGQKTLQYRPSALDRVNVRRLLIFAKKTVAAFAKFLLFEPNNANTWTKFLNKVNPILEKVRQDQGIDRFKVVMDSTTNTPDLIDRNTMAGKIFLQPTRTAEYIDLSFVISATGVAFEE